MASLTPDYTIANNSHCIIHTGPIGSNQQDPGVDFTRITSGGNSCVHAKNGNKTEYVTNTWHEESGFKLKDGKGVARTILAKRGDIHITADDGDIYLKARNIYIETADEKPGGNFLVSSNGQIILSGQDNVKIASGTMICLSGKAKIALVSGQLLSSGKFIDSGPASTGDFISQFMAGNFQSLVSGLLQSCK